MVLVLNPMDKPDELAVLAYRLGILSLDNAFALIEGTRQFYIPIPRKRREGSDTRLTF